MTLKEASGRHRPSFLFHLAHLKRPIPKTKPNSNTSLIQTSRTTDTHLGRVGASIRTTQPHRGGGGGGGGVGGGPLTSGSDVSPAAPDRAASPHQQALPQIKNRSSSSITQLLSSPVHSCLLSRSESALCEDHGQRAGEKFTHFL